MNRFCRIIILFLIIICLIGCNDVIDEPVVQHDAEQTEAPTELGKPVLVRQEEEKRVMPPEQMLQYENYIPSFYVELRDVGWIYPLYAFLDKDGVVQYRAYVDITTYFGDSLYRYDRGFLAVNINEDDDKNFTPTYTFDTELGFVDDKGQAATEYGSGHFFPRGEDGKPVEGAIPVTLWHDQKSQIMHEYYVLANGRRIEVNSYAKFVDYSTQAPTATPSHTPMPTPAPTTVPSPVPTEVPEVTPAPTVVPTDTPDVTQTPEATDVPSETEAPEPTAPPDVPEEP